MKSAKIYYTSFLTGRFLWFLLPFLILSCTKEGQDNEVISIPVISTDQVKDITSSTAKIYGNIVSNGGIRNLGKARVVVSGFVWSSSPNPTVSDPKTTNGPTNGEFSTTISGLEPLTTYYIKSYATNAAGTGYGTEISFSTGTPPPETNTYTDDFEREDPGADWAIKKGNFQIHDGRLSAAGGGDMYAVYRAAGSELISGDGHSYSFGIDANISEGGNSFGGIVFHAQDNGGCYLMRSQQYHGADAPGATLVQLLKFENEALTELNLQDIFFSGTLTGPGVYIGQYRIEVSSSEPGKFILRFMDPDSRAVMVEQSFQDIGVPFKGGYAGVYSGDFSGDGGPHSWDNLEIETE